MNVPSIRMSCFVDIKEHFVQYNKMNEYSFATRKLFGEYLQNTLNDYIQLTRNLIKIQHIQEEVNDIEKYNNKYKIKLNNNEIIAD